MVHLNFPKKHNKKKEKKIITVATMGKEQKKTSPRLDDNLNRPEDCQKPQLWNKQEQVPKHQLSEH